MAAAGCGERGRPEPCPHRRPFRRAGDIVLFQGRRLAHAVRTLRGRPAERLTLAMGLYVLGHRERGLVPGRDVSAAEEEKFWHVERARAEVLASLERLRRRAAWVDGIDRHGCPRVQGRMTLARLPGEIPAVADGRGADPGGSG